MKQVYLGLHRAYLNNLLSDLHEAGLLEITNIWDAESKLRAALNEGERRPEIEKCAESIQDIATLLDVLGESREEEEEGILQLLLSPRPPRKISVDKKDFHQLCREAEEVVSGAGAAVDMKRSLDALRARLGILREQQESIALLAPFDLDLGYLGESELLYTVPVVIDTPAYQRFAEKIEKERFDTLYSSGIENGSQMVVILTTLREDRDRLDHLLQDPYIRILEIEPFTGAPREKIEAIRSEIEALHRRERELMEEVRAIDAHYGEHLRQLHEEVCIEKDRLMTHTHFGWTHDTVVIEGWAAEKDCGRLQEICDAATAGHVFCKFHDPDGTPELVPVCYDNPGWLRPFEAVTTMFARPRYGEVDPTLFTAPVLILFFALMLGDAVYGLIITVIAALLYRGAGKVSSTIRDGSIILMAAGVATVVSGILQGGYMGDFLPRFLGITPPFVIINALEEPIVFLRLALIIGIVQINLGLCIAAFQNLRKKRYTELLKGQVSWFFLQPAAAVMLFAFFGWGAFSRPVMIASVLAAVVGSGLILLRSGPLGFFDLTGFLGDWLSYARLLALALATGGIAMTVNILAQMVAGDNPLFLILAAFIFIAGQTFNFVLQTLGAFIHSLRLQFVEFFGKFYTGGGKEFSPFMAKREITELNGGGV
ncbi:MAG TPA: V-type ATP synthase subunit I [Methanoculleus sp.]|nr:V-type ATP synthase subunit I [Methanoculleus sp.]